MNSADVQAHRAIAMRAMLSAPEFKGVDPETLKAVWPAIMTAARILATSYQQSPPVRPMVLVNGTEEAIA